MGKNSVFTCVETFDINGEVGTAEVGGVEEVATRIKELVSNTYRVKSVLAEETTFKGKSLTVSVDMDSVTEYSVRKIVVNLVCEKDHDKIRLYGELESASGKEIPEDDVDTFSGTFQRVRDTLEFRYG